MNSPISRLALFQSVIVGNPTHLLLPTHYLFMYHSCIILHLGLPIIRIRRIGGFAIISFIFVCSTFPSTCSDWRSPDKLPTFFSLTVFYVLSKPLLSSVLLSSALSVSPQSLVVLSVKNSLSRFSPFPLPNQKTLVGVGCSCFSLSTLLRITSSTRSEWHSRKSSFFSPFHPSQRHLGHSDCSSYLSLSWPHTYSICATICGSLHVHINRLFGWLPIILF